MNNGNKILFIEMVVFFAGIPLLLYFYQTPVLKLIILLSASIYSLIYVLRIKKVNPHGKFTMKFTNPQIKYFLIRVIIVSMMIFLMGITFRSDAVLNLPYNVKLIPLVLIGYPLLSVLPQELIYRLYFFERYKTGIINLYLAVFINSLLFAFMHIIYGNPIAVIMTFFGGLLFCLTYCSSSSLLLTVTEHTIYGYVVFLSGYGQYFMSDNIFRLLFNTR